jgi:hypothetical protein
LPIGGGGFLFLENNNNNKSVLVVYSICYDFYWMPFRFLGKNMDHPLEVWSDFQFGY